MNNVFVITFLLGAALMLLLFTVKDAFADRISLLFTMILTFVVFKNWLAEYLPQIECAIEEVESLAARKNIEH